MRSLYSIHLLSFVALHILLRNFSTDGFPGLSCQAINFKIKIPGKEATRIVILSSIITERAFFAIFVNPMTDIAGVASGGQ